MKTEKFSIKKRIKSFRHAFAGIRKFLLSEHNARVHLAATITVLIASLVLHVSATEAIELAVAVGLVWMAEMFNTCSEKIMDFISLQQHPGIRFIKDVAAGAVLVASFIALLIGLIIFIPKII
jgi:diacylglycerol kinase (ATP)